jgi:hypothetical protein
MRLYALVETRRPRSDQRPYLCEQDAAPCTHLRTASDELDWQDSYASRRLSSTARPTRAELTVGRPVSPIGALLAASPVFRPFAASLRQRSARVCATA